VINMTTQTLRLSLSMPKDIVVGVDIMASRKRLTRSKLISKCLEEMLEREKRELLVEGYRVMAKEHSEFAALSSHAAKEALPSW
jgi:metal-responsive CopG/Arc/MetJ family transcriptional regulator